MRGKNPTLLPIKPPKEKKRSHQKKSNVGLEGHQDCDRADLMLPMAIAGKPTVGRLASGKFQKAVLAYFATPASAALFKGMILEAETGNVAAARLLADMYQYVAQKQGGVNILVNQNNSNASHSGRNSDGPQSFEQIARILEEESQQRRALPPAALDAQFESVPDAAIEE